GQPRSGGQQRAAPGSSLVGQKRIHVHLPADAVSAVALDNAELPPVAGLGRVGGGFDGVRYVGQAVAGNHGGNAGLHRLLGRLRQQFVGGDERSDTERDRGVTVPAVQDCAAVDG